MDAGDPGTLIGPIRVGQVAHGGHFVARFEGRVIFVRHTLPGELVMARVTSSSKKQFWRADAIQILEPSPDRIQAACPVAGICGGCDFQHIPLATQCALKRDVVAEQLHRLARITWDGQVHLAPPVNVADGPGLGWRTRMRYWRDGDSLGIRVHRSHQVVDLVQCGCLLASPDGPQPAELVNTPGGYVDVVVADSGVTVMGESVTQGDEIVTQLVHGRSFEVAASGFWQIHPDAARILSDAVVSGLDPRPGSKALDLYCGVGLFAGALSSRRVKVTGVESYVKAVELARRNVPDARFITGPVEKALKQLREVDYLVLDPPRSGAGVKVSAALARLNAERVAYVACDPAALARDLPVWLNAGYRIDSLEGFDLFPMTHHVECVCLMSRVK